MRYCIDRSNGYVDYIFTEQAEAEEFADLNGQEATQVRIGHDTTHWRVRLSEADPIIFSPPWPVVRPARRKEEHHATTPAL